MQQHRRTIGNNSTWLESIIEDDDSHNLVVEEASFCKAIKTNITARPWLPSSRVAYLRHSNLHVTNKYLQATSNAKRVAQDKLVDAILPTGLLPAPKLIQ